MVPSQQDPHHPHSPPNTLLQSSSSSEEEELDSSDMHPIEQQIEDLQSKLSTIEALEERNAAQIDSFIDAEDQWKSLEEWERTLLSEKEEIVEQLEVLGEELVQLWMGVKSREG